MSPEVFAWSQPLCRPGKLRTVSGFSQRDDNQLWATKCQRLFSAKLRRARNPTLRSDLRGSCPALARGAKTPKALELCYRSTFWRFSFHAESGREESSQSHHGA